MFTSDTAREMGEYPAMKTGAIPLKASGPSGVTRLHMRTGVVDVLKPERKK